MSAIAARRGIDHTGIGVADIHEAARFYTRTLATVGLIPLMHLSRDRTPASGEDDPRLGGIGYGVTHPVFWIDVFHPHSTRQHTAFKAMSRVEVDAFHAAGLAVGGRDNGVPGLRTGGYPPGYYAAFVFDPDGNNVEAVFREGAA